MASYTDGTSIIVLLAVFVACFEVESLMLIFETCKADIFFEVLETVSRTPVLSGFQKQ